MSLKYVILGLLRQRPHYGYEIKQQFDHSLGEIWPVSYGQLYPTLRRLSLSGHISMQTVPGKKAIDKNVYTLTEKGRADFEDWFDRRVKKTQISIKDEFTLFLFFTQDSDMGRLLPAVRKNHDVVSRQEAIFQSRLEALGESAPFFQRALLKKMIFHLEAERIWLEEIIMMSQRSDPQGVQRG